MSQNFFQAMKIMAVPKNILANLGKSFVCVNEILKNTKLIINLIINIFY